MEVTVRNLWGISTDTDRIPLLLRDYWGEKVVPVHLLLNKQLTGSIQVLGGGG